MHLRRLVLASVALPFVGCGTADPTSESKPSCPTTGALVITEVMANPSGADQQEWLEIHNPTSKPIDLAGLTVQVESVGTNRHVFTKGRVEPGAYFVHETELRQSMRPRRMTCS